jgi:hypothetical protein
MSRFRVKISDIFGVIVSIVIILSILAGFVDIWHYYFPYKPTIEETCGVDGKVPPENKEYWDKQLFKIQDERTQFRKSILIDRITDAYEIEKIKIEENYNQSIRSILYDGKPPLATDLTTTQSDFLKKSTDLLNVQKQHIMKLTEQRFQKCEDLILKKIGE